MWLMCVSKLITYYWIIQKLFSPICTNFLYTILFLPIYTKFLYIKHFNKREISKTENKGFSAFKRDHNRMQKESVITEQKPVLVSVFAA